MKKIISILASLFLAVAILQPASPALAYDPNLPNLALYSEPEFDPGQGSVGTSISVVTYPTFDIEPDSMTFQWYRGSSKISKATKPSYKLTSSDWHKKISVKITAKANGYNTYSNLWSVVDRVLKTVTWTGTISPWIAFDSCDYDDSYSSDCWQHTKNKKWACGWNEEVYSSDYTHMNFSVRNPLSSASVTWRVKVSGQLTADSVTILPATDEGLAYVDTSNMKHYFSDGTWTSGWSDVAPSSDNLLHFGLYIGSYGGVILKNVTVEAKGLN